MRCFDFKGLCQSLNSLVTDKGEGQAEEEEDTKERHMVETTSGRPRQVNWHLQARMFNQQVSDFVQVLELATASGDTQSN